MIRFSQKTNLILFAKHHSLNLRNVQMFIAPNKFLKNTDDNKKSLAKKNANDQKNATKNVKIGENKGKYDKQEKYGKHDKYDKQHKNYEVSGKNDKYAKNDKNKNDYTKNQDKYGKNHHKYPSKDDKNDKKSKFINHDEKDDKKYINLENDLPLTSPIIEIQQNDDSEIGDVPIFDPDHNQVKFSPIPDKKLLEPTKKGPFKMNIPQIYDDPNDPFTHVNMAKMRIFKEIYDNYNNEGGNRVYKRDKLYERHYLHKFMKANLDLQMKLYPHSIENQSFEVPLGLQDQYNYYRNLSESFDDLKIKLFPGPHEEISQINKNEEEYSFLLHSNTLIKILNDLDNETNPAEITFLKNNFQKKIILFERKLKSELDMGKYPSFSFGAIKAIPGREEFLSISHLFFDNKLYQSNFNAILTFTIDDIFKKYLIDKKFKKNFQV